MTLNKPIRRLALDIGLIAAASTALAKIIGPAIVFAMMALQ